MNPRRKAALTIVIILGIVAIALVILLALGSTTPPTGTGAVENFVIIANANGFNDSVDHGVPQNSWPVIQVPQGTTVNITVINDDHQAHGFQITHYFDSTIETVSPGQKLTVTFVASEVGDFRIYCSIFCTVHAFMQSGELTVT